MAVQHARLNVDPAFLAEVRGVAVDNIRGTAPTTVLGLIMSNPGGLTISALARRLHVSREAVLDTVAVLESEDLCERVRRGKRTAVMPFAAFSTRNQHTYQ
jgi:predicted ArsR family transcriptional regulator